MNAIIACAAPGSTLTFVSGSYPGGLIVNTPQLTFDLNNVTIGAGSPAFTINAPDTTILGPGILDGNGNSSPAILVKANGDNFILDGVEIREWLDGVQVEGSVEFDQDR